MGSGKHLDKVEKAIEKFNKYRSPEAHAELYSAEKDSFSIIFSGSFCRTCGFHDYFDDFRIFLEEMGVKTEIADIEEGDEVNIVRFGYGKTPGKS